MKNTKNHPIKTIKALKPTKNKLIMISNHKKFKNLIDINN